jgi:hypothetical protein
VVAVFESSAPSTTGVEAFPVLAQAAMTFRAIDIHTGNKQIEIHSQALTVEAVTYANTTISIELCLFWSSPRLSERELEPVLIRPVDQLTEQLREQPLLF